MNPANRSEFKEVSPERCVPYYPYFVVHMISHEFGISINRAFADFAMGSIVLHFFVYNFLG